MRLDVCIVVWLGLDVWPARLAWTHTPWVAKSSFYCMAREISLYMCKCCVACLQSEYNTAGYISCCSILYKLRMLWVRCLVLSRRDGHIAGKAIILSDWLGLWCLLPLKQLPIFRVSIRQWCMHSTEAVCLLVSYPAELERKVRLGTRLAMFLQTSIAGWDSHHMKSCILMTFNCLLCYKSACMVLLW